MTTTSTTQNPNEHKIFLLGISKDISLQDLIGLFQSRFSSFIKVEMKRRNKSNGKIAGYAFLSVESKSEYDEILAENKFSLKGRSFFAKPYLKGKRLKEFRDGVHKKRVFVIGLPFSMKNPEFGALISRKFGPLEYAFVVNSGQSSKGFGYATFVKLEDAHKAIKKGGFTRRNRFIKIINFMKKDEGLLLNGSPLELEAKQNLAKNLKNHQIAQNGSSSRFTPKLVFPRGKIPPSFHLNHYQEAQVSHQNYQPHYQKGRKSSNMYEDLQYSRPSYNQHQLPRKRHHHSPQPSTCLKFPESLNELKTVNQLLSSQRLRVESNHFAENLQFNYSSKKNLNLDISKFSPWNFTNLGCLDTTKFPMMMPYLSNEISQSFSNKQIEL